MNKLTDRSATLKILLSPPHISGNEMAFIQKAFESNFIAPLGPMAGAFEQEFADKVGISHALALSSGTAAMHLALRLLGVGPGDEVIASTLTFIGSITPIVFQGAIPIFIDSESSSWNMDVELLAKEIEACKRLGKLPKAVVPTDIYGQCADLDQILDICKPYDIPVIADSAEALGAKYLTQRRKDAKNGRENENAFLGEIGGLARGNFLHAGKGAKAAVFSFHGNKIITTSGGGMLASDDKELIDHARKLSQQAREDFPHYEHEEIGYNYRMSNILAAIGRGQLRVLDERVKRKREIFNYYHEALNDIQGIEFMPEAPYGKSNRWLTVILITPEKFGADREKVRLALETENIEARPVWKPMHMQPVFGCRRKAKDVRLKAKDNIRTYNARVVGGAVAEDLFERGLCLPSGTAMTESDLNRVIEVIKRCKR